MYKYECVLLAFEGCGCAFAEKKEQPYPFWYLSLHALLEMSFFDDNTLLPTLTHVHVRAQTYTHKHTVDTHTLFSYALIAVLCDPQGALLLPHTHVHT